MKIYTNTSFKGHYPVGTAAVVVAKDKKEAARLLSIELSKIGLVQGVASEDMEKVTTTKPAVMVLNDGDY